MVLTGDAFTLPVRQLADRHGMRLTKDDRKMGGRRTLDPLPTAEEAKAMCEAAFAQQ